MQAITHGEILILIERLQETVHDINYISSQGHFSETNPRQKKSFKMLQMRALNPRLPVQTLKKMHTTWAVNASRIYTLIFPGRGKHTSRPRCCQIWDHRSLPEMKGGFCQLGLKVAILSIIRRHQQHKLV